MDSEVLDEINAVIDSNEYQIEEVIVNNDEVVENDKEAIRFKRLLKTFFGALTFVNAVLITCLIYLNFFMWNPKERDFCEDNLFCGDLLAVSDQVLDDVVNSLEKELGIDISEDNKESYLLINAVLENDNLTKSQKQIFYNFVDLINDNPYIDKEAAYSSLRNVDVNYKCRPYYIDKNVQGIYSYPYESIGIFEEDKDNSILIHEGIHCIFCNEKTASLPEYFEEGVTELLVNEYFEEDSFVELSVYPFEILVVKMLCELTSPDVVLEAFSRGSMDVIAEELAEVTRDIDVARNTLTALDKVFLKYSGNLEEDISYEALFNEFVPVFRGIIGAKYKEGSDNREAYYYNEVLFNNIVKEDAYDSYIDDLIYLGSYHKAYFSSKLKEELALRDALEVVEESSTKEYTKQ